MRNNSVGVAGEVRIGKHAFGMGTTPPGEACTSGSIETSGAPIRPRHMPGSISAHAVVFHGDASNAVRSVGVGDGSAAMDMALPGAARARAAKTTLVMAAVAHIIASIAISVCFIRIPWGVFLAR